MAGNAERILEMGGAFQNSRVLLTGFELGVFEAIGEDSLASVQVAERIGANPRATDRLLNALAALGLLDKTVDLFSIPIDTRDALIPSRPGYVGGALGHMLSLWRTWSTLTEAVRAGTSVIERDQEAREHYVEPFIAAMHFRASRQAGRVLGHIDLRHVRRVLDVGGGSGAYSIAFCRANPDITAVVFDQPDVVPLTQHYAAEAGLSDRISTVTGDFTRDELGRDFDLAWLSQVLHSNSPAENAELIKRAYRALKPGGQIVVQEFVVDEGRTSPPWAVLFALNMLVGTKAGDTFTESEIRAWFTDAGFTDIRRADPLDTGSTLILAKKR